MSGARLVELIVSKHVMGSGEEDNPFRNVIELAAKDGTLLITLDEHTQEIRLHVDNLQNALMSPECDARFT